MKMDGIEKDFVTFMMAKAEGLTDFQIAFLGMARFLYEKNLINEFRIWVDEKK